MQFIRKTAVGVAASLLVITLFSFGLTFGIQRVFGSPDTIKQALKNSGVYNSALTTALDKAQKEMVKDQAPGDSQDEIPIDNPDVQRIIKDAASPQFLQTTSEGAIDGLYAWLEGKTDTLAVTVDLTDAKVRLADGLRDYVQSKLSTLPPCASAQLPSGGDVDPFTATCVPAGFDVSNAAAEARDNIMNGEFLKDPKFALASAKDENGRPLEQKIRDVPKVYQRANQGVYLTGVIALLLALAVVFLSATKPRGVRKVAITLIVVGVFLGALGWLGVLTADKAQEQILKTTADTAVVNQVFSVVKPVVSNLRFWWMATGIGMIVIGIAKLVALYFMKRSTDEKVLGKSPDRPEDMDDMAAPAAGEDAPEGMLAAEGAKDDKAKAHTPKPKVNPKRRLVQ